MLPSSLQTASLTVESAAAARYGLTVGLVWFVPGMALVTLYFVFVYRRFAGRVSLDSGGH